MIVRSLFVDSLVGAQQSVVQGVPEIPPELIEVQVKAIPGARALPIDSNAGHFICCNADHQATWIMGEAIREFLLELSTR